MKRKMKEGRQLDKSASFPCWDEYKIRLEEKKQVFIQGHTLWVNSVLKQKSEPPVQDLRLSVTDGVTVPTLLQILGNDKVNVAGDGQVPLSKPQKVENLQHCVDFLEGQGVDVQGLSPTELADGNLKSTLMLMNSIRKKYDTQYTQNKDVLPASPKLKSRHSVTSLPSFINRDMSDSPPPLPPPPPPRSKPQATYNNNMIGKKQPAPPPPLPSVPPPQPSMTQPLQQPASSGAMTLKGQRSASPPMDILPGTIASPEEMNGQVEITNLKVTSTEVDKDQVSQMGPEGQQHLYTYPPETAQSLKDTMRRGGAHHRGAASSKQQNGPPQPPTASPGPPSRAAQAWQANSGPNTPTASRARTAQNTKTSTGPSVQEQLNHLLSGVSGGEKGRGQANGAFQPDDGELLVVPPPTETNRNQAHLKGFPASYQPSLPSDRPSANSRSQAIMSHPPPPSQPQGPPVYRASLPRYQPPPQYSPAGPIPSQQPLRGSAGSESSVFTSGSGNSTPITQNVIVPNVVPNNVTGPPQRQGMASNDLRNAWNKLYGQEPKAQNIMSSQSMENFSRPKSPSKHTPVHSRQGSQVSHHRRSSPMGQSSSPRSHSSSSQGGVSPNESHLPQPVTSGASHSHTASLDNTKSSSDSFPSGHVNLGFQGTAVNPSSFSNRYPEDTEHSQPMMVNGAGVPPKSPVRSGASSSVLHSSPSRNVTSGYEQNVNGRVGYNNEQNQRPKTPVFTEQRSKTPTSFDHQRQSSNPNYELQTYSTNNVSHVPKPQTNYLNKPPQTMNNVDIRQSGTGQDQLLSADPRKPGYQLNQGTDQRHSGYGQNSMFNAQEQRPKTPVGHEQRPTTPHEQAVPVSVQHGLPLSNGLPKSINQTNNSTNHGANVTQDAKSWHVDTSGRPTNAVQMRMEQLKLKSKESQKQTYENIYVEQQHSKALSASAGNGVHGRQKSHEETLQMQELNSKTLSQAIRNSTQPGQSSKSPYLNSHNIRVTGNHNPHKPAHDLSDGSATPPLPALSPDNSPPITPPESPGHVREQRSHAPFLPHSTNEHMLTQPARVKPPSGRRQAKKSGHIGVKSKKSQHHHSSRHGSRNIPGHSSHSRSLHARPTADQLSESQMEDYVDSELASTEDLDGAGVTVGSQEGKVIRQQLEGLESMYGEILKVLGLDKDYLPGSRRSISSNSSISQVTGSRRFRRTQHRRELKHVNKRFQRLESHVVTLARSVAQLSSEMHSQGNLYQELDDIKLEMTDMKRAVAAIGSTQPPLPLHHGPQNEWERFRGWVPGLTNPKRVNKLKQFFGAEPPLLHIFLKKLGYENFTKNFENEHITMIELPYLNEQRLEKIGIPMGPRLRILQESQLCFRQENFDIYIV